MKVRFNRLREILKEMEDDGDTKGKKDQSWAAMCDESDSDEEGHQDNYGSEELNKAALHAAPIQQNSESSIQQNHGPPFCAYVSNFEYSVTAADILDFFANGNCIVKQSGIQIIRDSVTKKSKGACLGKSVLFFRFKA